MTRTIYGMMIAAMVSGCASDDVSPMTSDSIDGGVGGSSATGGATVVELGGSATGGNITGGTSTGGAATGGGSTGGAAVATGGSSTGGVSTGGALSTGGSTATGGSAQTGGSSTGGVMTGGAATGGKSTGGSATGGSGTGGAPAVDCASRNYHGALCEYSNDPTNPAACLVRLSPMASTVCSYNASLVCRAGATDFDMACYNACRACQPGYESTASGVAACNAAIAASNTAAGRPSGGSCKWSA